MPHSKRDVMLQYTCIIQHHFNPTEYSTYKPMPHAKHDIMLQYTHIIQHHFKLMEYSAYKPMPKCHMQNVMLCFNIPESFNIISNRRNIPLINQCQNATCKTRCHVAIYPHHSTSFQTEGIFRS